MYTEVKAKKSEVRKFLDATFPEYRGRTFSVRFTDTFTFHDTNWGGGSKNDYVLVTIDGQVKNVVPGVPWDNAIEGKTTVIPPSGMIVEHTIFCGHDLGIRFYLNTCHAPKWLGE